MLRTTEAPADGEPNAGQTPLTRHIQPMLRTTEAPADGEQNAVALR
jgi:hypothetical protein